jgi:hypothetical protein
MRDQSEQSCDKLKSCRGDTCMRLAKVRPPGARMRCAHSRMLQFCRVLAGKRVKRGGSGKRVWAGHAFSVRSKAWHRPAALGARGAGGGSFPRRRIASAFSGRKGWSRQNEQRGMGSDPSTRLPTRPPAGVHGCRSLTRSTACPRRPGRPPSTPAPATTRWVAASGRWPWPAPGSGRSRST